jgi:hypothetical protein
MLPACCVKWLSRFYWQQGDNNAWEDAIEFYNLGLGEYYTFASISGSGTGLDALIDAFR